MENSSHSSANPISQGCGPHSNILIHVSPTTGGDFYLTVEPDISVDNFKKLVSKRLKVPRDRICLLFRDKWVSCTFYFYSYDIFRWVSGNYKMGILHNMASRMGPELLYCPMLKRGLSYVQIFFFLSLITDILIHLHVLIIDSYYTTQYHSLHCLFFVVIQ